MNMSQNRQLQHNLRAKAFGDALRKGIREDVMMRACFESDKPLSKREEKLQAKMERMLEVGCRKELAERENRSRLEAKAALNALRKGIRWDVKTE